MTIRKKYILINFSVTIFVLLIIFVLWLRMQHSIFNYTLIISLILVFEFLKIDKRMYVYFYQKYMNILNEELDPEKFIEITQNEYDRNKNKRYRNYMKLNLCAGYSSLGKVEEAYQNLKDIDLSKKSLFREQDKILYYYNEALLLHGLERKEEAIVIYKEKVLKMMEKFKTKKGIDETIQQLCNNMNLLDSDKYRKICNYMNTRVYLYPILLFNNLLRNIKSNNLIEYIDLNIYKYKNLLILPIGIFMLQDGNESITHHKLNQEISELIEILGVDLTNCDFDFYIESRKDLWLY